MSPMRLVRITAMMAPPAPMIIARTAMKATLELTGRYSGGALSDARAGSSDGATGKPSAAFSGVWLGSVTAGSALLLELSEHRRRGEIDLRATEPRFEQI